MAILTSNLESFFGNFFGKKIFYPFFVPLRRSAAGASAACRGEAMPAQPLRISTWNVLADCYVSPKRYEYVGDASALSWARRARQIKSILTRTRADILALQEVDHPEDLSGTLTAAGYLSHFERRSGGRQDGCLTAWRADVLDIVGKPVRVQFDDLVSAAAAAGKDSAIGAARHLRHNVGVVCCFSFRPRQPTTSTASPPNILVANAHLYWSPVCEDVKLLQARHLLRAVDLMEENLTSTSSSCSLGSCLLKFPISITPEPLLGSHELLFSRCPRVSLFPQINTTLLPDGTDASFTMRNMKIQ